MRALIGLLAASVCVACSDIASGQSGEGTNRVVLLTLDAVSDRHLDHLIQTGRLDEDGFFLTALRRGYTSSHLQTINVSNTGPVHAALYSGAPPSVSGFVGTNFLTPGAALSQPVSAFRYVSEVETLVSAARRQGRRVICVQAPGFDGRTANYDCDEQLVFTSARGPSQALMLRPINALADGRQGVIQGDFEHVLELGVDTASPEEPPALLAGGTVRIFAVDSVPDGHRVFDAVYIHTPWGGLERLPEDAIYPLERLDGELVVMSALWVNHLDESTGDVFLYWGQEHETHVRGDMLSGVIAQAGGWPGDLDARGFHQGRMTDRGFQQHNAYRSQYLVGLFEAVMDQDGWDLMIGYLPYLDDIKHEYLVTSPRQPDYSTKASAYADVVDNSYLNLDSWLQRLVHRPDAARTNIIAVSDHGMIPIHTALSLPNLLGRFGYETQGERPAAAVYTSGASVHIYLNGEDREGGYLSATEKAAAVHDLIERLSGLVDEDGRPVFAFVGAGSDLAHLDLDHAGNAGDVFASAVPGIGLDSRAAPTDRLFFPVSFDLEVLRAQGLTPDEALFMNRGFFNQVSPGIHGHLSNTPGMEAVLHAVGPDIPTLAAGPAHILQVTPLVACLLGVEPPVTAIAGIPEGLCQTR